jgi:RND family efflux transporter MFP subunit
MRYILPLLVLLSAALIIKMIIATGPQSSPQQPPSAIPLTVAAQPLQRQDITITIASNGIIQPRSQASIASQVTGTVTLLAPTFVNGGFFNAGDLLLQIDDRDYRIASKIAAASLIEAKLKLAEETARSQQAQRDWQRLGRSGMASELVLRKPQLASANAAVASAQARLEQAELDLSRTRVTAPYAGRVRNKHVDIGQFINAGTALADIYATDYVEVRLPLNSQQQGFIAIPGQFKQAASAPLPLVTITAQFGQDSYSWPALLTHAEGALDSNSRQLYTVAQINDPYNNSQSNKPPLQIGQFVQAQIKGRQLQGVIVIPTASIYEGNQVIIYIDGVLQRRNIELVWQDSEISIVKRGLLVGELLVTTPLDAVISGTPAQLQSQASPAVDNKNEVTP